MVKFINFPDLIDAFGTSVGTDTDSAVIFYRRGRRARRANQITGEQVVSVLKDGRRIHDEVDAHIENA